MIFQSKLSFEAEERRIERESMQAPLSRDWKRERERERRTNNDDRRGRMGLNNNSARDEHSPPQQLHAPSLSTSLSLSLDSRAKSFATGKLACRSHSRRGHKRDSAKGLSELIRIVDLQLLACGLQQLTWPEVNRRAVHHNHRSIGQLPLSLAIRLASERSSPLPVFISFVSHAGRLGTLHGVRDATNRKAVVWPFNCRFTASGHRLR